MIVMVPDAGPSVAGLKLTVMVQFRAHGEVGATSVALGKSAARRDRADAQRDASRVGEGRSLWKAGCTHQC